MAHAVEDLGIRGPAALEDAFNQAVAAPYRRIDLTVRIEENSGAWTRFQNLIVGVAAVLQIANLAFVLPGQGPHRGALERPKTATGWQFRSYVAR